MGGVIQSVFGGSKESSKQQSSSSSLSENVNNATLMNALHGNIGLGNNAMSTLGSFLGIGDPAAGKTSMTNFLNSTGYDFLKNEGERGVVGSMAAKGLLNSGASGKALQKFRVGLASTKVNELLQSLTGLGQYGLGSGAILADTGQRSTSQSQSTGESTGSSSKGIFNQLFPGGISDRRVKQNIVKVGEFDDGLAVYEFEYVFAPGHKQVGVMADEVAMFRPEAMGPTFHGYATVNYSKILPLPGFAFTVGKEV